MALTPGELRALLLRPRWKNSDFRRATGWTKDEVRRWREKAGLRGRYTYTKQLQAIDPLLWESLRLGSRLDAA